LQEVYKDHFVLCNKAELEEFKKQIRGDGKWRK
jgi:hypothetical protein